MKHAEFYSKNKFEKLVHLVGFIIRIFANGFLLNEILMQCLANDVLCFDFPHRSLHGLVSFSQQMAGTALNTGILSDP
jgi:hypothetical protein